MTAQSYIKSRFYKYENYNVPVASSILPSTKFKYTDYDYKCDSTFVPASKWGKSEPKKFKIGEKVIVKTAAGFDTLATIVRHSGIKNCAELYEIKTVTGHKWWEYPDRIKSCKVNNNKTRTGESYQGTNGEEIYYGHEHYWRIYDTTAEESTLLLWDNNKVWSCIEEEDLILIEKNDKHEINIRINKFDFVEVSFEIFEEPASYTEVFYNYNEAEFIEYLKKECKRHKKTFLV